MIPTRIFPLGRGGKKAPTAADYVQSGLVAMWDGIENAGWGVHDASATVWKDLIGNRDWTLGPSASYTWTGNSFDAKKQNAATMSFVNGSLVTAMEFCVRTKAAASPSSGNSAFILIGRESSSAAPYYGLLYRRGPDDVRALMGGRAYYTATYSEFAGSRVSVSFPDYADLNGVAYFNGASRSASGDNTLDYNASTRGTIARIGGIASESMPVEVFCVRLYSRALTAEKIAHNYAIDKERFNLP